MKISIITPWKQKDKDLLGLEENYIKRLPWQVQMREVKSLEKAEISGFVIALDEQGENLSSRQFAELLRDKQAVSFVIGEADGLPENLRKSADKLISFGRLTWPHKLVRVLLCEQIYRGWSLLNNHPYHRD